jgi:hypothetical protein
MTWLEDVEAAWASWDEFGWGPGFEQEDAEVLAAAARRLVSLGEGEKVEWCEVHGDHVFPGDSECGIAAVVPCRMVSRLLVDPVAITNPSHSDPGLVVGDPVRLEGED